MEQFPPGVAPTYKGETAFLPIIVCDQKLALKFSAKDEGFLHGIPPSEPVDRIELEFKDPSLLAIHEKNEGKAARIQGSLIIDQNNRLLPVKFAVSHLEILKPTGGAEVTTPKPGTPLRKAICDAFRVPMAKEVNGQDIVLVIHGLNVMGDWAFIHCSLQLENGKKVDWSKTKYKASAAKDELENNAVGLLKKDSTGKWSVVRHSFNHTDLPWIGWSEKYGVSEKLFR